MFSWSAIKKRIGGFLPDNKLGDWARKKLGIGTDTEEVALADTKDPKEDSKAQNPEAKKEKETETADADLQKAKTEETAKATSQSQTELAMLNTNMLQLIELTKKNTTAVKALNGNIMAG